ncbi:MFS transporter [Sciscionella marina]|uniref:MFS transporter n=1 Tax=Sciscionella marina TaxID=508770 RepID=UPI00037E532A|nr:MFS transporter [Sciscionella marina]
MRFVIVVGVMSFFADFTYEGSRSILGQYLGLLGAGTLTIAVISGLGELLGYGLRLLSGPGADRTGWYWPITIGGYVLQMSAVPLLALATSWQFAAVLVILERIGKAIRNPPRDAMLSHAAAGMGYGWAFGIHEALDQFGAMIGPLVIALALAVSAHDYRLAFAVLAVPAALMLALLVAARFLYPRPQDFESTNTATNGPGHPRMFRVYVVATALVAMGFADFPVMAFHFQQNGVPTVITPIFYASAMAVSGAGSLAFGRLFDRVGIGLLVPLTVIAAVYAPLAFLGGFWPSLIGSCLWGLGIGVHESIIPAAVGSMVPPARRASAYGILTGSYGIAWFAGSVAIGALIGVSFPAVVSFSVAIQLAAIPLLLVVRRERRPARAR